MLVDKVKNSISKIKPTRPLTGTMILYAFGFLMVLTIIIDFDSKITQLHSAIVEMQKEEFKQKEIIKEHSLTIKKLQETIADTQSAKNSAL